MWSTIWSFPHLVRARNLNNCLNVCTTQYRCQSLPDLISEQWQSMPLDPLGTCRWSIVTHLSLSLSLSLCMCVCVCRVFSATLPFILRSPLHSLSILPHVPHPLFTPSHFLSSTSPPPLFPPLPFPCSRMIRYNA